MPSQHQKRLIVIGWVDPIHGLHGMMKCNTKSFLAFLKNITHRFKNKIIDLRVDDPRWHKGDKVKIICEAHWHIAIHYLPQYYPELNCQEILWRTMRYKETTNVYFETFESLKKAVFKRP